MPFSTSTNFLTAESVRFATMLARSLMSSSITLRLLKVSMAMAESIVSFFIVPSNRLKFAVGRSMGDSFSRS